MYQFLCLFFLYAFLGWCTEVGYAALKTGQFVNRGFLNGPLCPIYGFGVVIVLAFLVPLKNYWAALFLGAMLLTSLLELVTGFVLEKIFRQHWWDYSDEPFNLGGYICLRFSILWGLACTFVVYILHPTVELFICLIPHTAGVIALWLCGAYSVVDLIATVQTITKMNHRLSRIDELAAKLKSASNEFGENLAEKVLDAAEKGAAAREHHQEKQLAHRAQVEQWRAELRELTEQHSFGQRRLLRAFPGMRSTHHHQALEHLRERLEHRRKD